MASSTRRTCRRSGPFLPRRSSRSSGSGRGPGEEVLVRDDVRLLQVRGDLRAAAEGRDVEGDRVALREAVLLREDLDPPLVESLGEGLRVLDDLRGIVAAELQEFRERDPEGRHRMEVVVR